MIPDVTSIIAGKDALHEAIKIGKRSVYRDTLGEVVAYLHNNHLFITEINAHSNSKT
jgi:hypothetical protein